MNLQFFKNIDRPNIGNYFNKVINHCIIKDNAIILGWLMSDQHNYYLLDLHSNNNNFTACTPLLYFKCNLSTDFQFDTDIINYPYIILTIGCDDGSIGWKFKTKEEVIFFIELFEDVVNNYNGCFNDYYEFLMYFKDNKFYIN